MLEPVAWWKGAHSLNSRSHMQMTEQPLHLAARSSKRTWRFSDIERNFFAPRWYHLLDLATSAWRRLLLAETVLPSWADRLR
jgi:hypothetical protein